MRLGTLAVDPPHPVTLQGQLCVQSGSSTPSQDRMDDIWTAGVILISAALGRVQRRAWYCPWQLGKSTL
jgi:hypothetical protein